MNMQAAPITHEAPVSCALVGKVAVVTGSTSGIGLGVARALAKAGARLVINGLGEAKEIDKTRRRLAEQFRVDVRYDNSNLMESAGVARLIDGAVNAFGQVDILVNNAGIQHVAPVEEFPGDKWDAILALNLSAAFHATRLVLGAMKENGYGRIINIASAHGLVASPFKAAYVAAKHGLIGFTKTVALEAAEFGVTANAICPGYVWTPLVERQIDEQAAAHGIPRDQVVRDVLLAQQPNKRFATVEEIGALAAFLASANGASITGTALPVDGGWTAH
ncbi:3-hydroxybutyrate dehydrogenase [Bosea psychrotolerans]|uniref:3-hydroxybutyrate dehydrogenase n=1 Tax=Bosea psychrotolerans TaxID=1871628 RepID=A0A2S4M882_9HYPH|nr:3-hydroxybutyrate dehydrogenase [Bosea psychrotolerans]POR50809.1 3-hydroxybutyrate dehydrogenase [Bosea psychrotolerans]